MANLAHGFTAFLDEKNVKYDKHDHDGTVLVAVTAGAKNTDHITVNLVFEEDDAHVSIHCIGFIKATANTYANALIACNEANRKYRWVKFVIDEDMDINAMDDAIAGSEQANEELFELMIRMMQIVDEAYPQFEQAMND